MEFRSADWQIFCTPNPNAKDYAVLAHSPVCDIAFRYNHAEKFQLNGIDAQGVPFCATEVARESYDLLREALERRKRFFIGYLPWEMKLPSPNHPMIPTETVWAALRCELSEDEIRALCTRTPTPDDYFDLPLFLEGIHRYMRGETTHWYHRRWLDMITKAMCATPFGINDPLRYLYGELAGVVNDVLDRDALPFVCESECRELIAYFKWCDHRIRQHRNGTEQPFANADGSEIFVCFEHCHDHIFYRFCRIDPAERSFYITDIHNPDFLESVNYGFVSQEEFAKLPYRYYGARRILKADISPYIVQMEYPRDV